MNASDMGVTTTARSAMEQRVALGRFYRSQLLERLSRALVSLPRRQLSRPARLSTARAALSVRATAWRYGSTAAQLAGAATVGLAAASPAARATPPSTPPQHHRAWRGKGRNRFIPPRYRAPQALGLVWARPAARRRAEPMSRSVPLAQPFTDQKPGAPK